MSLIEFVDQLLNDNSRVDSPLFFSKLDIGNFLDDAITDRDT